MPKPNFLESKAESKQEIPFDLAKPNSRKQQITPYINESEIRSISESHPRARAIKDYRKLPNVMKKEKKDQRKETPYHNYLALERDGSKNSIKGTLPISGHQNQIIPTLIDVPNLNSITKK